MANPIILIRWIDNTSLQDKIFQRVEYGKGIEAEWAETKYHYSTINFKPASGHFPAIGRALRWYKAYLDSEDGYGKDN